MAEDRILIRVEPDATDFQTELTNDLSRVTAKPVEVPVEADTTRAKVTIQKFQTSEGADPIQKPVDVDTTRARNLLRTFSAQAATPIHKLLNVDTTGAQKSLRAVGSVGSKAFGTIGAAAKGAGVGALLALGSAAVAGKDELLDMNRVSGETAGILKRAGLSAKISTKQIEDLSGALLAKSGIDDQAIQSGTNLLLSQKAFQDTLKQNPALLKKSTEALTNLASTPFFKGNAEAAAKGFGKALADPIKGIAGLRKAGILFTEAEKDKIKTLVESGKASEAQALIIDKVQARTAGAAEARGKTVEGMLGKLSEAFAGAGAGILSKILPTIVKLGGAVQKAFGDGGIVTRFLNALKPLGRVIKVIGDSFQTAFSGVGEGTSFIDGLASAMEKLAVFVEQNQVNITAFALVIKDLVVALGGVIKALAPVLFPVLKMFGLLVGILLIGLAKVVTVIANVISAFLRWKGALAIIALVLAAFVGFPVVVATALGLLVAYVIKHFDDIVGFLKTVPAMAVAALKSLGGFIMRVIRGAFALAINAAKIVLNLYIAYLRAVPLRILQSIAALGQMLWTFITNVWTKFKSITVTLVGAYISFVRSIPGKILGAIGAVATLLYQKGQDVFEGFFDGLKHVWEKIKGWLSGIGKKIKSLKGPIEVDRVLLVDEGKAIMEGFHHGLKDKWSGVEGWLGKRGGFISGLLSNVGLGKVTDDIGKLLAGETSIQHVIDTIDKESMSGLHPSSGLSDTQQQAGILHNILGIVATTFKDGHSKFVAGTNRISQHFLGLAADFGDATAGNDHANLDKAAKWMSRLVGKVFSQIIWRNAFWTGGKMGPSGAISGHTNHLHAGWLARRNGGGVRRGQNYRVGEDGEEHFIPNTNGFIINNQRLNRMLNVDRRLGALETGGMAKPSMGAQVNQQVTINMPPNNAADAQGYAMLTVNRLLPMLRANSTALAGGIA